MEGAGKRILFISKQKTGGAGIAAWRLFEEMKKNYPEINWSWLDLQTLTNQRKKELLPRLLRKIKAKFYQVEVMPNSTIPFERVSSICGPLTVAPKGYDLIHLHDVAGFINIPTFFQSTTIPIVWTFHDMNPFLGVFHYSKDGKNHLNTSLGSFDCEQLKLKQKAYKNATIKSIITPSQWMCDLVKMSEVFIGVPIKVIPNVVDSDIYNKSTIKRITKNQESTTILFVSEKLSNPRKGYDKLVKIITKIKTAKHEVQFLIVGKTDDVETLECSNVKYLGFINDEEQMAEIYRSADYTIMLSEEDNSPNVVHESIACGTPVFGLGVGGVFEGCEVEENKSIIIKNLTKQFTLIGPVVGKRGRSKISNKDVFNLYKQHYLMQKNEIV